MEAKPNQVDQQNADREKKWVALTSVLAAIFLTTMKLVVGLLTGSLGILSEAAHSGLDLVAALVTYFAVRISGRPADSRYTYGYGKVENLSALIETVLLLLTCVWIIYEAIQRLFFKSVEVEASIWAFVIMGVSILIDLGRSRALSRIAEKHNSQALEADALHFSTDIWSSSVVIIGLFLVLLSNQLNIPWLEKADAVAAIGVAGIVVYVSIQLGWRTITALLDAVPAGMCDEVEGAVRVPGVEDVQRVRIRRSGPETFADVALTVKQDIPLEQAHDIAAKAEAAVRRILPGVDVMVYIEPGDADVDEELHAFIRRIANRNGLNVHSIRFYENGTDSHSLELHLEVSEHLHLEEAHERAMQFERTLREAPLHFDRIVTHLEPVGDDSSTREATLSDEIRVLQVLKEIEDEFGINCRSHEVLVHRSDGELSLSFHCVMEGKIPIGQAHQTTEMIERLLRSRIPELGRVVIHTEPEEQG